MVRGRFLSGDDDLSSVYEVRRRIFCEELGEDESSVFDGRDAICMHAAVYADDGSVAAAGRGEMNGHSCRISFIGVLPQHRKKEYGDFIVRMLCDRAFACNASEVTLYARPAAVAFYEHIGFGVSDAEKDKNGFIPMLLAKEDFISPCKKCSEKKL